MFLFLLLMAYEIDEENSKVSPSISFSRLWGIQRLKKHNNFSNNIIWEIFTCPLFFTQDFMKKILERFWPIRNLGLWSCESSYWGLWQKKCLYMWKCLKFLKAQSLISNYIMVLCFNIGYNCMIIKKKKMLLILLLFF